MNAVVLQPAAFLCMLYGGMIIGIAYDVFRLPRRLFRNRVCTGICDVLFAVCAAAITVGSLYWATSGELRPYTVVGLIGGIALEQVSISRVFFGALHGILGIFWKKR